MNINIKERLQKKGIYLVLSFLIPIGIMAIIYYLRGIYPGSTGYTILTSDSYYQYANFYSHFGEVLRNQDSLLYTWNGSLGLNYWTMIAYYLGGLFSPLVFFFTPEQMPEFIYYLTLLKIGCIGTAFYVYAAQTFKIPKWVSLQLSLAYALMSFTIAYSEIIMWMDALIYLPLIILGIDRILYKRKPSLLFVAYILLFISNFYMAFMVGVFSFLYAVIQLIINWKQVGKQWVMYGVTAITAGFSSMFVTLPVLFDLRENGEALSSIQHIFTRYTGVWDLVVKSMVGVYDSTQVRSSPYIYAGLIALIFTIFFFTTWKISKKQKLAVGILLLLLALSFYLEPLNLLWQGMHTPNMFNFRYSFLFSFTLLMAAGYGCSVITKEDFEPLLNIGLGVMGIFLTVYFLSFLGGYDYLSFKSVLISLLMVIVYLFCFYVFWKKGHFAWGVIVLFIMAGCVEAGMNSYQLITGIAYEWHYPARKFYSADYQEIKGMVDKTKKDENHTFYRMENLAKGTQNDSFKYDYHGVSLFSSIRNRHSSAYLNQLGFRSTGTNLKIDYANNTLLMDYLLGIRYNIAKDEPSKFGYDLVESQANYNLFRNEYAMSLGCLTDKGIYEEGAFESQTVLLNHLAETNYELFSFAPLQLVDQDNVKLKEKMVNRTKVMTYQPINREGEVVLSWRASIPARKQAYISLYPVDNFKINEAKAILEVNGKRTENFVADAGQFYSLGYFEEPQMVEIKLTFQNLGKGLQGKYSDLSFVDPDIALLNVDDFTEMTRRIQKKEIDFNVRGSEVSTEVDLKQNQVLFTTIPYDSSWQVYVNGKKEKIKPFQNAFLSLELPKGHHTVQFVFVPKGIVIGSLFSIFGTLGFGFYLLFLRKQFFSRKNE